jgi:hypothetical protein
MKSRQLLVLLVAGSGAVLLFPYFLHTTGGVPENESEHKAEVTKFRSANQPNIRCHFEQTTLRKISYAGLFRIEASRARSSKKRVGKAW